MSLHEKRQWTVADCQAEADRLVEQFRATHDQDERYTLHHQLRYWQRRARIQAARDQEQSHGTQAMPPMPPNGRLTYHIITGLVLIWLLIIVAVRGCGNGPVGETQGTFQAGGAFTLADATCQKLTSTIYAHLAKKEANSENRQ